MIIDIYLHCEVLSVLKCYGSLDDVVDKLLTMVENGEIDMETLPACPPANSATRYKINVTNEYYISLCSIYPKNSSKISIRRLLYWFVEEDKASEFGWIPTSKFINTKHVKFNKLLKEAIDYLNKSKKYANSNKVYDLDAIINNIDKLQE